MKRFYTWTDLSEQQQCEALAKLNRLADRKARYDGTVMPFGWAERIAPLLRYTLSRGSIWDCNPTLADSKRGYSLFTLPVPTLEEAQP